VGDRMGFHENILAQKRGRPLDIDEKSFFGTANKFTRRLLMTAKRARVVCVLALCLGLAFSSMSVLAQKSGGVPSEKINLNSATSEQLQSIAGIGPATAKNILEYRTKVGKFNKIEEVINVKGIGEKKFQKIKDRLTV
jgi:comEA protein